VWAFNPKTVKGAATVKVSIFVMQWENISNEDLNTDMDINESTD
jgi:hypothetical protein